MPDSSNEKILVVGPSWVGDMVMAQSLFITLKQRFPGSHLSVLAPDWTFPLLQRMQEVDESLSGNFSHGELALGKRKRLGRELIGHNFTRAIVLPNSFKSALVPYHARIPHRVAWRGEMRQPLLTDCRKLDKENFPLMVQRFVALGLPVSEKPPGDIPLPSLAVSGESQEQALARHGLGTGRPVLALCPGAEFGDAKCWPYEHFADVANRFVGAGWQVWLFGSGNDRLAAEAICADMDLQHLDHCHDLCGKTSLAEAIDLLALAQLSISNDSGLMHVSAALDVPVVSLYGSTSPDFTPPLANRVKLLHTEIECRPCFKRECPYGHKRCLTELSPERVSAAALDLIEIT